MLHFFWPGGAGALDCGAVMSVLRPGAFGDSYGPALAVLPSPTSLSTMAETSQRLAQELSTSSAVVEPEETASLAIMPSVPPPAPRQRIL